jgi:hypothetical protein
MAETNSGNGHLMRYAQIVSQLGVPVVISLFMVWWITSLISSDMHEAQADRRQIIELIRDQNRQMDSNFQVYGSMLYAICINAAGENEYRRSVCNQQAVPRSSAPSERK